MSRNYFALLALVLVTCCSVMVIPVIAQSSGDALTRGNQFSITITGKPNTPYYVWDARTFSLSGEPGDQPPVIVSYQQNLEKDPSGGPYVIGNYAYSGGGGRTIRDDVAPSTSSMSNTNYYAQVTTDSNGEAIVGFQTSANTATRTFSVHVENPHNPNDASFTVQRGTRTTRPGSVSIGMERTTTLVIPPTPVPIPTVTTLEPEVTIPVPIPTETPTQGPTQTMPPGLVWSVVALGFAIWTVRNR